ncbi:hypothetical protein CKO42_08920 [Lamprobacter modestohalophilus]|uniref:Uncharacterized protein n=2 Tax=Lamprobacter modestohalophilus TaxID=1064514 RepID=A0A9X1B4F3_9GAMM|nr:hypothetical protein [Lamprobacter modestohalophilus]
MKAQGLEQVSVRNLAAAATPGPVTFFRYNLPGAGAIHPAAALNDLFPGIRERDAIQLSAIGICELIASLGLSADADHALVLELAGEELASLKALLNCDLLHVFGSVSVFCGRQPLYENGASGQMISDWLEDQGFALVERDETEDPDRPRWSYKRNPLKIECRALEAQLEQSKRNKDDIATDRDQQAKLAAERQARIEELTTALNAAKAETQKQSQRASDRDQQAKLAAERQARIEELSDSLSALQRDNAMLLRMQALRDADLKDLQGRYAEVVDQKDRQTKLITQLTERLTVASSYLQQLNLDQLEAAQTDLSSQEGTTTESQSKSPAHKESPEALKGARPTSKRTNRNRTQ